jgi:hypothetical protein
VNAACPRCRSELELEPNQLDVPFDCPVCSGTVTVASQKSKPAPSAPVCPPAPSAPLPMQVVITGVRISFWGWVNLLLTIFVAMIPAALLCAILYAVIVVGIGAFLGK